MKKVLILLFLLTPCLAQSYPPSKYNILQIFTDSWLATDERVSPDEPYFYFPLHPHYFFPEDNTPLPILPCDVNRDGIVNWVDYAYLVDLMGQLNWFEDL